MSVLGEQTPANQDRQRVKTNCSAIYRRINHYDIAWCDRHATFRPRDQSGDVHHLRPVAYFPFLHVYLLSRRISQR